MINPKFPKKVHINPNINKQINMLSGLKNPKMPSSLNDKNSALSTVTARTIKNTVIKIF